ncbi:hypothetical protein GIB67_031324 [Kingdonia uniflora]|uniref:KIB1-4 beta-propeller domain-containing protein n=1 Tax=Kingdonia uniflora TaxID=39325 RepID=A0A7J7NSA7_9MAGN|nr:hypothetical protein GIB67_031324 [Kingdonia uniflora]
MSILKAVISSHPTLDNNGDDCTIMAIIGLERTGKTKLAFCKLGDQKWSAIQDDEEREFEDLSYCNGRLYALDESSEAIVVCNIGPSLGVRQIAVQPESYSEDGSNYLIEFCGDLLHLQVKWCYEDGGRISGFKFFRLEQNNQTWSEVKSLGDYSLFLEFRGSISLLASDHPGVKPNCIYFLEYTNELLCVVFSLDNCSFEYFSVDTGCRITVVSLWVTPSLW